MEVEYITLSNGDKIEKKIYSKYTNDELRKIIVLSSSISNMLEIMGLNRYYHTYIRRFILDNDICVKHFTVKVVASPRKIEDILQKGTKATSGHTLKKYLLEKACIKHECSICHLPPEWNGKPLTLQVDHINGEHTDNRVENLRLICPNCHTQTDTYTGRNLRVYKQKFCSACKKEIRSESVTGKCAECINKEKTLCTICKVNKRPGKNSICTPCSKIKREPRYCNVCNEEIKRYTTKEDYHMKCFKKAHEMNIIKSKKI